MKNFYPIQVGDLGYHNDHITPKKIRIFQEYENALENTNSYVILIKHKKIIMVSERRKILELNLNDKT